MAMAVGEVDISLLEIAKARDRLIEFGKLLLQAQPGQGRRARHVDLAIKIKHPRPVALALAVEHLGEEFLGVVEAAAHSTVLNAVLFALNVGKARDHARVQCVARRLLALEYVGGRDFRILESYRIQRDAFEDGVERVFPFGWHSTIDAGSPAIPVTAE
jgi:hypothetical protein